MLYCKFRENIMREGGVVMGRLKGIGGKLTSLVLLLLIFIIATLGMIAVINSSKAVNEQVQSSLVKQAKEVKNYINEKTGRILDDIESIAQHPTIQGMSLEQQLAYLEGEIAKNPEYQTFGIVKESGMATFLTGDEVDLSDREFVQKALSGQTAISDIVKSGLTNEPAMIAATPIQTVTGEKAALIVQMDGYTLANISAETKVGETGFTLILTQTGTVLGHQNFDWVKEQLNFIEQAEQNNKFLSEAAILKEEVLVKDEGIARYESESGGVRYLAYSTMDNGWKIGLVAMEEEFLASIHKLQQLFIIVSIVMLTIGAIFTFIISKSITRPIEGIVKASEVLATGDFTRDIDESYRKRKDEIGLLAASLQLMRDNTRNAIVQVNAGSKQVQDASMTMGTSVEQMREMTDKIVENVSEVSEGSLAQLTMAEESAVSMEQMSQGIQNIAEMATTVVGNVEYIRLKMTEGLDAVNSSILQMQDIQAGTEHEKAIIYELDKESQEIGQISKMITDIADQTNLLALNASIEAARAGEAGKGFAVVADEVRKLSEQTASSAAQINNLIAKVQVHTRDAVNATNGSASNVAEGISTIGEVGERFKAVADAMVSINGEIEGMSAATEQMSANSEEVSAAMEEMASTARNANEYVQQVTASMQEQRAAIGAIEQETELLEEMANQLQGAVKIFKC